MKASSYLSIVLLFTLMLSCGRSPVELWDFNTLENYINTSSKEEKLKVVNFWATWCAPCLKEMPYFEEARSSDPDNVELIFVSLDHSEELKSKVIPLLEKKNIKSKVVIMTDENYNVWIDKVDPSWTGAIPATLFVTNKGERLFYEKEFERDEIEDLINKLKPKNNTL